MPRNTRKQPVHALRRPWGLTPQELMVLQRLDTPEKIQTFLEGLAYNRELDGETCRSPRGVLKHKEAHCMEGALFAAACLRMHGKKPLLLDLTAKRDHDHVVCVFKRGRYWGAISKSKFHSLGYRNPIYRSIRELALSYLPSYHNYRGEKTLFSASVPFDVSVFDRIGWMTSDKDLWDIGWKLCQIKHERLTPKGVKLRPVPRAAQYADVAQPPDGWKNRKPTRGH